LNQRELEQVSSIYWLAIVTQRKVKQNNASLDAHERTERAIKRLFQEASWGRGERGPVFQGKKDMNKGDGSAPTADRRSPWLGIVKFVFIVFMTIIIWLLAKAMVRHRFHGGGRINQNDTLMP
jgi:hypothetical protein